MKRILNEGLLHEERDVGVRLASSGGGASFRADLSLTRAAFYLFDRSGRREPMRLGMGREREQDFAVSEVVMGAVGERGEATVRVRVEGPSAFWIEFGSGQAGTWWTELRRATGRSSDLRRHLEQTVEEAEGAASEA
jgi:hypothetical protein